MWETIIINIITDYNIFDYLKVIIVVFSYITYLSFSKT